MFVISNYLVLLYILILRKVLLFSALLSSWSPQKVNIATNRTPKGVLFFFGPATYATAVTSYEESRKIF